MAEKVKGRVKWFSNRKGFGFITPTSDNAPTTDDIFVHQSSIVTEADFRSLRDGFETEFEVVTEDAGFKAVNVTSADGTPCPGPEPRKRRPKKSSSGAKEDEATEDDNGKENGKGGGDRRSKNTGTKPAALAKKEDSWENDLDENVKKALESKSLAINGGRAFLAIGDARIKLGTDGYAALAHSAALLAEGKWTVEPNGVVTITWERVLKLDGDEWAPSTAEAEKEILVSEINLVDDSVKPTEAEETTATLWGEDKTDPKEALEKHNFQMRKMILNAKQAIVRRRRGRGRRSGNKNKGKPESAASTD
ncbi:MAG: hypothetical protein SGILL_001592 [Bacillariaceae sp.]